MKLKDLFEEQRVIEGDVHVQSNVTKLDYEGAVVTGFFDCSHRRIKSLKGSPSRVLRDFNCAYSDIKSLEGAPEYVGGSFDFYGTKITSLHNVHKYIKYIGGGLILPVDITSHVLGIMYIKGLQKIVIHVGRGEDFKLQQAARIVNKHLAGDRSVHDCQEEMLEAGLGEFAKL